MSIEQLPPWPEPIRELDPTDDERIAWRDDEIAALRARLALAVKALEMIDETAVAKRKGAIIVAQGIARATAAACREPA